MPWRRSTRWGWKGSISEEPVEIPRSVGKIAKVLQFYGIWLSRMAQLWCQVLEGHRVCSWILCGDVVDRHLLIVSTVPWILDKLFASRWLLLHQCRLLLTWSHGQYLSISYKPVEAPLLVHLSSFATFLLSVFLISWLIDHHHHHNNHHPYHNHVYIYIFIHTLTYVRTHR